MNPQKHRVTVPKSLRTIRLAPSPNCMGLLPRLAWLLLLALGATYPLAAATLTVTNLNDSGPGTLRQSIADAAPGDTVNFALNGTITLTSGELGINTNLIISGPGATNLSVTANFNSRVFNATGGTNVIAGLTIAKGFAGSISPEIFDNGGGIKNSTTLVLNNCILATNLAYGGDGGGVFNTGILTVSNCSFTGNIGVSGGGVENRNVTIITGSTFSGNSTAADGDGGGINNSGGTLIIRDSILSGNEAVGSSGGGIFNGGTMTVTNCIFSGNQAQRGDPAGGGAIYNQGVSTVTDSTLSSSFALLGGVYLQRRYICAQ